MTDRLIFRYGPAPNHMVGWTGPWPPPERMAIVMRGDRVGIVTEAERITPATIANFVGTSLVPHFFRLRNASTMPSTASEDDHWFRGAEYIPEEEP